MIDFSHAPRNLCIFRLSAIGDVTHILPVIHTLKKVWPETQVTWIIGRIEYELVKSLPDIEFIIFDKSRGWKSYLDLRDQLKGRRFDVLLMMQAALRASLASLLIRARHKLGYDRQRAVDFQQLFSNQTIQGNARVHVLDGFFQFLEAMGIDQKVLSWDLTIDDVDQEYAEIVGGDCPYVVINPCSSQRRNNWRNWSIENYARVSDYLHGKGYQVLLTGSSALAEIRFCESIVNSSESSPSNCAGETSLGRLLALIKGARFMIAPDTGPAHMATIVDTPVIGLFASSNPHRTGPYKSQHILIDKYPEALEKFNHKKLSQASWGERVRDPGVMELVEVELVTQRIQALIASDSE
jgi:heptosyltransferase I